MNYTVAAVVAVAVAGVLDLLVARTRMWLRRAFWISYAIVLCGQLVVNGLLTGLPVVTYDRHRILGPRLAYAPVEDLLFGFALISITLSLWVWWGRAGRFRPPAAEPSRRAPTRPARPAGGDAERPPPGR